MVVLAHECCDYLQINIFIVPKNRLPAIVSRRFFNTIVSLPLIN